MAKINITEESVTELLKSLEQSEEEIRDIFIKLDRSISNTEIDGWNDKNFYEFKDSFDDTRHLFFSGVQKIDEEHIPFLKKMIRGIENFE